MTITIVKCDVCGSVIPESDVLERIPCRVIFKLSSPPRKEYESSDFAQTCWTCVDALEHAFYTVVEERTKLKI